VRKLPQVEKYLHCHYTCGVIEVIEINSRGHLESAFEIRRQVFVIEQEVPADEEYDEFEESCVHFLAISKGIPAGTARIRETQHGIKLERFAVLKAHRTAGVGRALVYACLSHPKLSDPNIHVYMHAQEHAMGFYAKLGFEAEGDRFMECDIPHYTMVRKV
jgi:predicted GNAT family N-acyltransferase